jgi:hypothetical protein
MPSKTNHTGLVIDRPVRRPITVMGIWRRFFSACARASSAMGSPFQLYHSSLSHSWSLDWNRREHGSLRVARGRHNPKTITKDGYASVQRLEFHAVGEFHRYDLAWKYHAS